MGQLEDALRPLTSTHSVSPDRAITEERERDQRCQNGIGIGTFFLTPLMPNKNVSAYGFTTSTI